METELVTDVLRSVKLWQLSDIYKPSVTVQLSAVIKHTEPHGQAVVQEVKHLCH